MLEKKSQMTWVSKAQLATKVFNASMCIHIDLITHHKWVKLLLLQVLSVVAPAKIATKTWSRGPTSLLAVHYCPTILQIKKQFFFHKIQCWPILLS